MEKIEKFEDFMKIWEINHKYNYYGNRPITPKKFEELKSKSYIEDFKRYIIYMFEDGYYMIFDTKPKIENTLYFDDETPTPEKTLAYFINYNMQNFKYDINNYMQEIENLRVNGCCSGNVELKPFINLNYLNSKEVYPVLYQYCGNTRRDKNTIRDLTSEELKEYFKICEYLKQLYIERLKKYFDKYNKNINSMGYWANR